MASNIMIFRALSKGSTNVLLRCSNNVMQTKKITSSPVMSAYFEARRGPFTPDEKKGTGHMMDASTHWKVERVVAASLCGLIPASLFLQGAAMDHALSTVIYLHGFWGMNTIMEDYVDKYVPVMRKVWYLLAVVGFAGVVHFNYNDVGLCKAVAMLWSL